MRQLKIVGLAALVPAALLSASALAQSDNTCEVTVDRSQAAGTYAVTKQVLENGDCICYLYTGPAAEQATTLENRIRDLQRTRSCDDAPVMAVAGGAAAVGGAAAAGAGAAGAAAGGLGVAAVAPIAVAAAAGIAVAANGNDSPGG